MIAELRFYTMSPEHLAEGCRVFQDVTLRLFERHGFVCRGPWLRRLDRGAQLVYVVEFVDERDRGEKWSRFRSDPDWLAHREREARRGAPVIAAIESVSLGELPDSDAGQTHITVL